jgi:hypothetical protein
VRGGRSKIEHALGEVKRYLGVHRHFSWLGSYYQHANRLACLYFLNVKVGIRARLIELFFIGDVFPDGRRCPADEGEWRELLRARELTLGLPSRHPLSDRVHEVFLKAVPMDARGTVPSVSSDLFRTVNDVDDESLPFLRQLRDDNVLDASDLAKVASWVDEARSFLAGPNKTIEKDTAGRIVVDPDADPRNADWLKIVRVRRLTGYLIPDWASLWLWWLANQRGARFWSAVARVARNAGLEEIPSREKEP